ncbi:MAG: type IV secretion system protein [Terracidiphilus sp.]|jgi:type IV secretory pathway TrbL component
MGNVMNFFFTSTWAQAQGGLSGLTGVLQTISYSILAITLLLGVYESFLSGGSVRQLGVTFLKFGVAAAIIGNWNAFMTDVVNVGTTFATAFLGANGDLLTKWVADMNVTITGTSLTSLLENGVSAAAMGAIMVLIIMLSAIMFLLCMKLLTLCFVFWGGVLYCMGPLLISLGPSGHVSDITKKYCRSLAEWAMWPALYAMFCTLMVAIGMGNVSAVLGQSNGLPAGIGDPATNNSITLVLTSLLYGICIIIIPFIAHYVIGGSFAGVAAGVVATAKAGAVIATGGASGAAMGAGGAGGGASGGGGSSGGGVIGGGGSVSVPQSGEGSSTSLPPSRTPASRPPGRSSTSA